MRLGRLRKPDRPSSFDRALFIRTPRQPWAYGRILPVDVPPGGAIHAVRVSGWLLRGQAAIGMAGADTSMITDERRLPAALRPTPFATSLIVPDGEEANLIIRSGEDGVGAEVLVETITVMDHPTACPLGDPAYPHGSVRWNLALGGRHAGSAAERVRAMEAAAAGGDCEVPWFGGPLSVPASSQVGRAIMVTGTYEPGLLSVLGRLIPRGDTIVNAGGHVGVLATYLAWLAGPSSTLIAAEPSERERQYLIRNAVGRLDSGSIEVVDCALGAEDGTAFIHAASDFLSGHNSVSSDEDGGGKAVTVTTIDQIMVGRDNRASAIILDVEGMERDVLAGAGVTIARDRPVVVLEFDPEQPDSDVLPGGLADLDYEAVVVETSSGHVVPFPHVPTGSAWAIVARPRVGGSATLLDEARGIITAPSPIFAGANGGTVDTHDAAVVITTPARAWSYAASAHVHAEELGDGNVTLAATATANGGAADLLVVECEMGSIIEVTRLPDAPRSLRLALPSKWECPAGVDLIVRTADSDVAATVSLEDLQLEQPDAGPINPVLTAMRPEPAAPVAMTSGTAAFEDESAAAINTARRKWLASLPIQWRGKHVVDLGCGIGLFAPFFLDRDARYTGVDGRIDNVAAARAAIPKATFLQADARDIDLLQMIGVPDVVLAIGLLYHLDDPLALLKSIAGSGAATLILETMVSDFREPVVLRYPEPLDANQALDGVGCRPSISWLVQTLRSLGFATVGTTAAPPNHPDFQFRSYADGSTQRGDTSLRVALIATRVPELLPEGLLRV